MIAGIYLHIPFCGRKCPYCDFNTYTGMEHRIPRYMDALRGELKLRTAALGSSPGAMQSVYFGGGTPSLLPAAQVEQTLAEIDRCCGLDESTEVTLEANPGTVDLETLCAYRSAGINRLSIGCQSFRPEQLVALGRDHSVEDTLQVIEDAGTAGFQRINIDLMYGVSGQSLQHWSDDLATGLGTGAGHLSLYNLTIEAGTTFGRLHEAGKLPLPDEELLRDMYLLALSETQQHGLARYEVSNFARQGERCVHNRLYWLGQGWLGLGAGAHGFLPGSGEPHYGRRWWGLRSPVAYIEAVEAGHLPEEGAEELDRQQAITEQLLLSLRTTEGLDRVRFRQRFGFDAADAVGELEATGVLGVTDSRIRITEQSVIITDSLIEQVSRMVDRFGRSAILPRIGRPKGALQHDSGYRIHRFRG